MFGIRRKAAITAATAIFSTALLGGAALAAFSPTLSATTVVAGALGAPSAEAPRPDHADKIKQVLDALVAKNVITQAQEDAILAAFKDVKEDRGHEEFLRRMLANLFEQSAAYLEMRPADLRAALPGTSLGAIADRTPGKSKDGLVAYLTRYVNDAINKALTENKITREQADKAKAMVPDHVARFVEHVYPKKEPRAATPKVQAFIGDAMNASKDYLGLETKDIMAGLRSGKSLGEIANSTSGKSRDGLIAAITTSANAKIDKAAQDGKITADQATQLKAAVGNTVATLVDYKGQAHGPKPASR